MAGDAVAGLTDAPWAAALVAHHAITVYDRFRADPAWDDFFAGDGRRLRDAHPGAAPACP